jgi:hypothetical protein
VTSSKQGGSVSGGATPTSKASAVAAAHSNDHVQKGVSVAAITRIAIGNHIVTEVPRDQKYMADWQSYEDPPVSWYKTYSSMKYKVMGDFLASPTSQRVFHLEPVVGGTVYTFDNWGDVIQATRNFPLDLLFGKKSVPATVPMYRALSGPPRAHVIYALPPYWRFED